MTKSATYLLHSGFQITKGILKEKCQEGQDKGLFECANCEIVICFRTFLSCLGEGVKVRRKCDIIKFVSDAWHTGICTCILFLVPIIFHHTQHSRHNIDITEVAGFNTII